MKMTKYILFISFLTVSVLGYSQDGWLKCEGLSYSQIPTCKAINATNKTIEIDGIANENFWETAESYQLKISIINPAPKNTADLSASFKVAWDQNYLYAFITVTDDKLVTWDQRLDCKTWQTDCVEFFINPDMETGGKCPLMDGLGEGSEIHANPGNDDIIKNNLAGLGYHNTVAPIADYKYKSVVTQNGYTLEVQMPWYMMSKSLQTTMLSNAFREEVKIGFDVNICDADNAALGCKQLREHILSWASDTTTNFKNTSRYGILELLNSETTTGSINHPFIPESKVFIQGTDVRVETSSGLNQIEVFDSLGKRIKNFHPNNVKSFSFSKINFVPGVYIVMLKLNDGQREVIKKTFY